jgi:hypothetical protein
MSSPEQVTPTDSSSLVNEVVSAAIRNNTSQGITGFDIKPAEHPDDRASRIKQSEADAHIRRIKEVALFFAGLLLVLVIFGIAATVVLNTNSSADDKKWATSILSSIVTGTIAFLAGKSLKENDKK